LRCRKNDRKARVIGNFFDAADNLSVKRIGNAGHHDADGVGFTGDKAARDRAGGVSRFFRDALNAFRGVRGY
jgi:hypothetical protein